MMRAPISTRPGRPAALLLALPLAFLLWSCGGGEDPGPTGPPGDRGGPAADVAQATDDGGGSTADPGASEVSVRDPGQDPGVANDPGDGTDPGASDAQPADLPPEDLGCQPQCEGRVCGPNGCGSICGVCPFEKPQCNPEGQCVKEGTCEPKCGIKICGPDGCGFVCGFCNPGEFCSEQGQCSKKCDQQCGLPDGGIKECGPDGCGSLCGMCGEGFVCGKEGLCVLDCVPQCEDRVCGPDQCGGLCGLCPDSFSCKDDGICYQECNADCTGKECGGDGCGGHCGYCGFGEQCVEGGCVSASCGSIPSYGKCEGSILTICELGVVTNLNCYDSDLQCLWDPVGGKYDCVKAPDCIPDCFGRVCGGNGCGGICGSCPNGWACAGDGSACIAKEGGSCGPFSGSAGHCVEEVLWFCISDVLYREDCAAKAESCSFNAVKGKNVCQ